MRICVEVDTAAIDPSDREEVEKEIRAAVEREMKLLAARLIRHELGVRRRRAWAARGLR